MATIITKNSSTASAAPASGDLTKGELAVNVTDKKLYTKDNSAAIVKIVGSLGNQEANAVAITGGSVTGITDITVADGGTGASTAANARTNLGAAASGANSDITSITGLTTALTVAQGGTGVTTSTGTGAVVLSNSPTLVTPALGTPASGTATNLTGLPISTGVSGLGTGIATFLGTPSSANLASAVTDETGSGALVFANSPTLVTPALGTPSALVGTNITGTASGLTAGNVTTNANLTGAVTSVGNATSLGSFSSANLLGALTDETGTGSAVFATSPTLVTPILGTPTSATLTNATGLPISTGVSGLGTGVATALAVNVGSSGAPLVNGGVLGTPSSGTATNLTGLPISTGVSGLGTGVATALAVNVGSAGAAVVNGGALGTPSGGTATNLTGLPLSTGVTGTLPVANGGTGQTSYTDGQLLIGNSTGNTLTKATLTAGTNVTITNAAGAITIAATGGGGSGDVVGPASSTDNAFARFDSTTGKLLQNSTGATLSDTGAAVFTGALDVLGNSTAGSNIKLYEDTDNGTNYVSFKAPDTIAANVTWTLPAADGTSSQVLQTNGSGTLSFATVSGGASAATPTALGTVYGSMTTSGAAPYLTALGYNAGVSSTGTGVVAVGTSALFSNTTASYSTAVGYQALYTASTNGLNTAVGYQAGYATTTGSGDNLNSFFGYQAGKAVTSGYYVTALGATALLAATGVGNTGVGYAAGSLITSGAQNSILGGYNGNQDGLDIRTVNNYAVISDGQGNRLLSTADGKTLALDGGAVPQTGTGITFPATQSASSDANTLDDYEEGTWTPAVTVNTGTATTYSNQSGTYTKTGRVVVLLGFLIPTNGTLGSAGGYVRMTGLPFTPSAQVGAGSGVNSSNLNNGISTTLAYTSGGPTIDAAFESGVTNNNGYCFIVTFTV